MTRLQIFLFTILLVLFLQFLLQGENLVFGEVNYFHNRGLFFLIFIALFPRLTLLFSSVASGGIFWWLGFIFYPRLLVALLATVAYVKTNPLLVSVAWFVAITGEIFEKRTFRRPFFISKRVHWARFNRNSQRNTNSPKHSSDVIDAKYSKIE